MRERYPYRFFDFGNPVAQLRRLLASSLVYFHPERVVYFPRNIHNVATLGVYFSWPYFTTSYALDILLLIILLLGINSCIFFRKKKYKEIIQRCKSAPQPRRNLIAFLLLIYALTTIVVFYFVHSNRNMIG